MPETVFIYDDASLDALASNGVRWQDADYVLRHAQPVIRERIGVAVLRMIGQDLATAWLMVTCLEQDDDTYLVVSARYLDNDEAATVARILGTE